MKTVFLVLIVLLLIINKIFRTRLTKYVRNTKKIPICNIDNIQEGDVVAVCGDWYYSKNVPLYVLLNLCQFGRYNNIYTHFGIVVRYNNKLCICHTALYTSVDAIDNMSFIRNKPVIEDLYTYIGKYDGIITIIPSKPNYLINNKILDYYMSNSHIELDSNPLKWFVDVGLKTRFFHRENYQTCYEYLYNMLCHIYGKNPDNITMTNNDLCIFLSNLGYDLEKKYIIHNTYCKLFSR